MGAMRLESSASTWRLYTISYEIRPHRLPNAPPASSIYNLIGGSSPDGGQNVEWADERASHDDAAR